MDKTDRRIQIGMGKGSQHRNQIFGILVPHQKKKWVKKHMFLSKEIV